MDSVAHPLDIGRFANIPSIYVCNISLAKNRTLQEVFGTLYIITAACVITAASFAIFKNVYGS